MNYKNKKKIINDPIYGFINIPSELSFDIIENSYFQRLRRIKQLGLTYLVYPGAIHTRFQHCLGAMHLMGIAMEALKGKGIDIEDKEVEGAIIAILLHDIGHGPFSHSLENVLIKKFDHEIISLKIFEQLNLKYNGSLDVGLKIFNNTYHKKYLHSLVSGQLDMDRLDYLKRDSFFTGVSEGVISTERIIKMLNIHGSGLVVEAKGIYSIENFIIARRLMFWQVYLHKTVLSAQHVLINLIKRAKYLLKQGETLFATPSFDFFLRNDIETLDNNVIEQFNDLDDYDVITSIKIWTKHKDKTLAFLSDAIINRKLFHIELQTESFSNELLDDYKKRAINKYKISNDEVNYYIITGNVINNMYNANQDKINILLKDNTINDIALASDQLNSSILSKVVEKHFLIYPKDLFK
ncbi:MAG: phosphohydrolase [Bacteroidetes bacterium GWE2_29_8]|nr:MAG: phosphohydrolase [Bacteroidetes bacterium GWE2_29_8]OFY14398.1 MAG: phosphohydrolase [Bacteroidetes bacterium GWF2_29_10]